MMKNIPPDLVSVYERKMALYPVIYGEIGTDKDEFGKIAGVYHSVVVVTYINGFSKWYFPYREWRHMSQTLVDKWEKHDFNVKKFEKNVRKYGEQAIVLLDEILKKIDSVDLLKLISILQEYNKLQRLVYNWGDPAIFIAENAGMEKLDRLLAKSIKDPSQRQTVTAKLVSLEKPSNSFNEECELVNIAITKDIPALKRHAKKWAHLAFDYVGPITSYNEFKKRYDELVKKDLTSKTNLCQNYSAIKRAVKNELIKKNNISKDAQKLAQIISKTSYIYDLRKGYLTEMTYLLSFVLDKVAKISKTKRIWFNWLLETEVVPFLERKIQITQKEIDERQKSCVVVYTKGKGIFLRGKEKADLLAMLENDKINENIKLIRGASGSVGFYRGKVNKIMSATDNGKMGKDDVLVAPMTTVYYLPAMRLAGAIVTDIGGITSHAAIVSRELQIPCIVGTKIATKVFNDGDLVEVDADNGIIKIIKRREK